MQAMCITFVNVMGKESEGSCGHIYLKSVVKTEFYFIKKKQL